MIGSSLSLWRTLAGEGGALKLANLVTLSRGVLIGPIFGLLLGSTDRAGRLIIYIGAAFHRSVRRLAGTAQWALIRLSARSWMRWWTTCSPWPSWVSCCSLIQAWGRGIAVALCDFVWRACRLSGGIMADDAPFSYVPFLVGENWRGAAVLPLAADGRHGLRSVAARGSRRDRIQPAGADLLHSPRRPEFERGAQLFTNL